jgi:hypothetical protein
MRSSRPLRPPRLPTPRRRGGRSGKRPTTVEHVAVVQQAIEDRRGDPGVAEHVAPLREALVGGQDQSDEKKLLFRGRGEIAFQPPRLPV